MRRCLAPRQAAAEAAAEAVAAAAAAVAGGDNAVGGYGSVGGDGRLLPLTPGEALLADAVLQVRAWQLHCAADGARVGQCGQCAWAHSGATASHQWMPSPGC